jgi:predicted nucleic acid-binding protein
MITADSSVWIGYFNGHQSDQVEMLDSVLEDSANEIIMLDVVLMEVLRGFRLEREWIVARDVLRRLPVATTGAEEGALAASSLYRNLRRNGITVRSPIDLLVGAWCIRNDCVLIHDDRDYVGMTAHHGLQGWKTS